MKLNTKRTLLVGFAFFMICAFWQAYDAIVPLMLVNKFGLSQTASGLIMALDNILALFMLPIFGALSDKTKTKYGKRTPFIVIGTVLAIVCFVGLTLADNAQIKKLADADNEVYWEANYEIANSEYESFTNNDVVKTYTVKDYASQIRFNKNFAQLSQAQQAEVKAWYMEVDFDSIYTFDKDTDTYTVAQRDENGVAPTGSITAFSNIVSPPRSQFAAGVTEGQIVVLIVFVALLLVTLISMAVFRSPAVALMPDVTVKPLRSKANAIINLMGTGGGMIVLGMGIVFGTGLVKNQIMSYTAYVCAVCGLMLAALLVFIFTVKEKKWNGEMLAQQAELDKKDSLKENTVTVNDNETISEIAEITPKKEHLSKKQLSSLILILASVALWFVGYNAITTKYSLYAINVLQKDYNTTLLIAQAAAIIAYIPVGMIATKLGRKKTILIGIGLLTAAFTGAMFVNSGTSTILMWALFALAGIAWATINVNSFPMVVELSQGGNIGKFTGYYYTASMAAQIVTPLLSGWIMDKMGNMSFLFPYGAIFVALSFVTMLFVKHGDSKPSTPVDKLDMLSDAD